ncbi:MAG TPA: OmpA family protein [bacterium]|nr:OmpA family protein [bacterium]
MKRHWPLLFALVLVLAPALVRAAEGFNAHLFSPTYFQGRYLTFEDAQTMPQYNWALGAYLNYANAPVEVRTDNERSTGILDSLLTADLTGGFSFHEMVNIGLHTPLHLYNRGRSFDDLGDATGATSRQNRTSLGDMRLTGKVRLLEEGVWPMGVAVMPFITFPTGDETRMLGEGRVTAGATATYEIDLAWVRMALNGGWHYRGGTRTLQTTVGNGFPFGVGLGRQATERLHLTLEAHGEAYESDSNDRFAGNPVELVLIGRYDLGDGMRIVAGGGPGLTSGVGSPDFRIMAGLDFRPVERALPPPSTGDLRVIVQDAGGHLLEAEVALEGPELRVGATTNGQYALTELSPGSYTVRVSRTDYQTATATVHVPAGQVATVTITLQKPETRLTVIVVDHDSEQRLAGTLIFRPGADDETTVLSPAGEISLPAPPGPLTFTAVAEGHEAVMTTVDVVEGKVNTTTVRLRKIIVKKGRIFFDLDSAVLRPESFAILDDVIAQIKQLMPKQVIVEGHCSDEGTDEYNLKLSQARAEAVRDYLIKHGVKTAAIETMAFGESRPIATNETEEGRERNRRVEFIIVEE